MKRLARRRSGRQINRVRRDLPRAIVSTFGIDLVYFEVWGDVTRAWPSGVGMFDVPASHHVFLA